MKCDPSRPGWTAPAGVHTDKRMAGSILRTRGACVTRNSTRTAHGPRIWNPQRTCKLRIVNSLQTHGHILDIAGVL
jgi:hypothetical protein